MDYCPLGHTESVHGIYCIVWGIRRIAMYLTRVYWPWFQRMVLRMPDLEKEGISGMFR